MKPSAQSPQGGIVEKEASIQLSNLSLLTSTGETTRIGRKEVDGNTVRYSKKSGDKYYDINCIETPAGGTWSWKDRSGRILLLL